MPKNLAARYHPPAHRGIRPPAMRESGPSLLDLARQTQAMRARTAQFFPRDVFRDSAWDMMLELFIADQQRRPICVKELILVSGESATSALRRIDRLEGAELLQRSTDPADHRRLAVTLTERGNAAMTAMLRQLFLTKGEGSHRGAEVRPD
ncbi:MULTISPECIES: winged helix DNA-binding protein [Sphingomonas]|jgi:DNA-binding MarR family transcriptional regulator|uniref:winged helix DNA-binding protein n=1 Tax=Sphingomonas TaxID=13687 RepID=UPI00254C9A6B|nr:MULTISPECIES: winged helix DNA-binding protein [Sphingomonas]MDK8186558.1 winged helix DNA-binding protein [Sphingomonas zeae]MDK8216217.1 winged helix DNA-binding protein [Sphingomonas sp. UMB7805-LC452B]